ncbi:MATE family efflux transporter [Methylocapsa palsarum]|uniref:Putative efflux protein, MATE family n=1 Tax=Methylocapsa palsarum TaxID=1612308 RepID=A0A1I3W7G8_9HYPH|nr:MATE family efflux transporter [Methylocapsa palsarum]SFK03435.1 putative efflux protein, MATE family [Methylocapsa palsarum]
MSGSNTTSQSCCVMDDPIESANVSKESARLGPANLADPRLASLILRLAMPSVLGLSINALHHVVNAAFIGMMGLEAIAAVSVALPIFLFVSALGHGLGVGSAATIGRLLGAHDADDASTTATVGLGLAGLLGLACTAGLLLWLTPILLFFGATDAVLSYAQDYVGVLAFGCALMLLQILCDFVVISEGNTRFSMWTLVGAFALNIVLDPIFIFGMGLGVAGAGLATITSQFAALTAFAIYFSRKIGILRIHWGLFRPRPDILRPILNVGVPATLTTALSAVAFTMVYRAAGAYGGDAAIAGVAIALRVLTFGELPLVGFCIGAQSVLSYAYGAGAPARVLAATRIMLIATTAFAIAYALTILAFPDAIVSLFTRDPVAASIGVKALVAFHICFTLTGIHLVTLVLLQSLDKGVFAGLVSLAPQGYLLIPLLVILPNFWGIEGVILSLPIAMGLTAALSLIFLLRERMLLQRTTDCSALPLSHLT